MQDEEPTSPTHYALSRSQQGRGSTPGYFHGCVCGVGSCGDGVGRPPTQSPCAPSVPLEADDSELQNVVCSGTRGEYVPKSVNTSPVHLKCGKAELRAGQSCLAKDLVQ